MTNFWYIKTSIDLIVPRYKGNSKLYLFESYCCFSTSNFLYQVIGGVNGKAPVGLKAVN